MVNTVPIKKNYEFLRIYKKGKFFVGKYITLYVLPNRMSIRRLGITASKKYGKSVKRNRIKRLVKESYRFYEEFVKPGFDYVFVARPVNDTEVADFTGVKKEMKFLLKKLNVFDREKWDCCKSCLLK